LYRSAEHVHLSQMVGPSVDGVQFVDFKVLNRPEAMPGTRPAGGWQMHH